MTKGGNLTSVKAIKRIIVQDEKGDKNQESQFEDRERTNKQTKIDPFMDVSLAL